MADAKKPAIVLAVQEKTEGMDPMMLYGIIGGAVVLLILLLVGIMCCCRKGKGATEGKVTNQITPQATSDRGDQSKDGLKQDQDNVSHGTVTPS